MNLLYDSKDSGSSLLGSGRVRSRKVPAGRAPFPSGPIGPGLSTTGPHRF